MPVRTLTLDGFRSYEHLEVAFGDGPQVVVGRNAAGKTNLVEALVVLSSGRSHRSSSDPELVRWGADLARVSARVELAGRSEELEVVIHARGAGPGTRKRIRVNGVNRRATALSAVLRTVLFAPEDMLLIVGSPTPRRSLLDGLVAQREPTAAALMSTYQRTLTQRNSLLRRIREEQADRAELAYWDSVIVEHGGRILDWRHETLAALAGPLAEAHREIAPDEADLALRYVSNVQAGPHERNEDALRRRLRETSDKEVWNGATLVGPHRDDFVFESGGRGLTEFASRGQQRTAILALKLAELDLLTQLDARPPLLLLDDVFSELDPERRAHLVRRIGSLPQAIVTTTTPDDLDPALVSASTLWQVAGGSVRPCAT
ncbi:MAG TPA: DNA replication/repair protein RecF [Anaerolineae bacterium]|nr:DNA replication/repair protein RecF [Anaerolineae bacterium]